MIERTEGRFDLKPNFLIRFSSRTFDRGAGIDVRLAFRQEHDRGVKSELRAMGLLFLPIDPRTPC
jgi:hypothetical protein